MTVAKNIKYNLSMSKKITNNIPLGGGKLYTEKNCSLPVFIFQTRQYVKGYIFFTLDADLLRDQM